eukprot:CAMPEP_0197182582 /NCGR_PEP_ID=MMETSP1423-20130617/6495_1 /TAXON_ID=476441 /ORGANISM="Pseudo-nitzschia heimii, Strain UNC1101" /LENGTH=349 /DNA_ID=CAMNT_0042633029 /DNA_START=195 /DNA_END=1244 /DNA_ORIENTATION=+
MSLASIAVAAFIAPPMTFAVVEANARTVRRHAAKQRSSNERNFRGIVQPANPNDTNSKRPADRVEPRQHSEGHPETFYTFEQSVEFLAEAIAHDREKALQRRSSSTAPTTTAVSALDRPREGIYMDKPVLRGRFHYWGAILYPPLLGLPLWLKGRATPETAVAALLFNFAVESILAMSARLHIVRWKTLRSFQVARFLDFAGIFFGIALFYSSMGRLLMGGYHPMLWNAIEGVVWACAVAGTVLKWRSKHQLCPPKINGIIFLIQGWATLPCFPSLIANAPGRVTGSLAGGAYFGTLGTLAYVFQWPNHSVKKAQREIVFGPHEMFHVGTLFLFGSFWLCMWFKLSELT